MEIKVTLDRAICTALLRYQIAHGYSTPAGAIAHIVVVALSEAGLF